MAKKLGLGKGLGSLIPPKNGNGSRPVATNTTLNAPSTQRAAINSVSNSDNTHSSVEIPALLNKVLDVSVEKIVPNPKQPRSVFDHQAMEDLVQSIKEYGILQPLTVTLLDGGNENGPTYELIAGERRLRASKMAGLKTVPVIVREASELEKLELAVIENIQRQDLNPIEEAESYYQLIDEFGLTQEDVAKRLGKPRSSVANSLRLLHLPSEIQLALAEGKLTKGHARALVGLESPAAQMKLFKKIINERLNVRDVEAAVRNKGTKPASSHFGYDPNVEAKKNAVQAALGTKVELKAKRDGSGELVIHYYSPEELNTIVNNIT